VKTGVKKQSSPKNALDADERLGNARKKGTETDYWQKFKIFRAKKEII
jgi:hypothetical protein